MLRNLKQTILIFGGDDTEAVEARRVAVEAGLMVGVATFQGQPVSAGTAYKADGCVLIQGNTDYRHDDPEMSFSVAAIIFECSPAAAGPLEVIARCDHHNPGDAGYDMGPEAFFEASSLGQLMMLLGIEPTQRQWLIAASDHCPAAAYKGLCPGIEPEEFRQHRLAEKVAFYATVPALAKKTDPEILEGLIAKAVEALGAAPVVDGVRDLRDAGLIDELPEAALRSGEAYMAKIADTDRDRQPTGNEKIVLGGHTTPEVVEAFMAWAATLPNRVGEPYGNPTRGFAGVVVKPE